MSETLRILDGLRVLIVAVDWHGDVAPHLGRGFEILGARPYVVYTFRQRRVGLHARLSDELVRTKRFGPIVRARRTRQADQLIAESVGRVRPELTVCLTPDTMTLRSVEAILGAGPVCWWFGDDPMAFRRRGQVAPPPVLEVTGEAGSRSFVAHPAWADGALANASYLPYASTGSRERAAILDRTIRFPFVVVGSPRPERAQIIGELYHWLAPHLNVWGWGPRGRLGINPAARPFWRAPRGWHTLSRHQIDMIYARAGVVLNLQDSQMVGAWNPQTFDVLGVGVPQVVWNQDPIAVLEHPPLSAHKADELARLVLEQLDEPRLDQVLGAHGEIVSRHLWHHRAATLTCGQMSW